MSGIALEATRPGFVPGSGETRIRRAEYKAVKDAELSRRLNLLSTVMGGWVVAGAATLGLGLSWFWFLAHPAPKPELRIGLIHDDGSYSAPELRDDLTPSQRYNLLVSTGAFYVKLRENYVWEAEKANYDLVSVMSTPDVRDAYQRMILNHKDPRNPETIYGAGVGAGRAMVSDVMVSIDRASPNVMTAYYVLHIQRSGGAAEQSIRRIARMTWEPAANHIPLKVQQQYDPAGIAFTGFEAFDAPGGAQ